MRLLDSHPELYLVVKSWVVSLVQTKYRDIKTQKYQILNIRYQNIKKTEKNLHIQ